MVRRRSGLLPLLPADGHADDRRGTPWVRSEVKTIVRVSLGIERRKDLAMQPGEPGAQSSPDKQ